MRVSSYPRELSPLLCPSTMSCPRKFLAAGALIDGAIGCNIVVRGSLEEYRDAACVSTTFVVSATLASRWQWLDLIQQCCVSIRFYQMVLESDALCDSSFGLYRSITAKTSRPHSWNSRTRFFLHALQSDKRYELGSLIRSYAY